MTHFIEINELYSMQLLIRHNCEISYFECPSIERHLTWFVFSLNLLCYDVVIKKVTENCIKFFLQLEKMQQLVAGIQNDAVWWLQETALRIYRPSASDFVHALHKVKRICNLFHINCMLLLAGRSIGQCIVYF